MVLLTRHDKGIAGENRAVRRQPEPLFYLAVVKQDAEFSHPGTRLEQAVAPRAARRPLATLFSVLPA